MFEQTECFIESLSDWNVKRKTSEQDFKTLIFMLLFEIGYGEGNSAFQLKDKTDSSMLNVLQERIETLVHDFGISEDLIVNGLVEKTTNLLERLISGHGEAILFHEHVIKEIGEDSPLQENLEKLKNPQYLTNAKKELALWEEIISLQHNKYQREVWRNQRLLEKSNHITDGIKNIPDEIKEILFEYPVGKLSKYVSPEEMKHLTVEQALLIKEEIDREE